MAALHADLFTELSGVVDPYSREYFNADYCHLSRRANEILADRIMRIVQAKPN